MATATTDYLTGVPMPDAIVKEINDRGTLGGASDWKVKKKAWIKLESGSSSNYPIGGYEKRSKSDFYEKADSGRLVAKPTINSAEINTTGTNGSMRKGTVKFTVYSMTQLKAVQKSYFIPGLSCLVQWGWNIKSNGDFITRIKSSTFESFSSGQQKVQDHIKAQKGCMDAMFGIISDFNWSFDPSSKSYSCEITIDSPGKAYISGPVDVANKGDGGCANKEDDDEGDGTGNAMKVMLKDVAEKNIEENVPWEPNGIYCGGSVNLDEDAKEDVSRWKQFTGWIGLSTAQNYYVTWAWWESSIISGMSPVSENHDPSSALASLGNTPQAKWSKNHVWRLDSSDSRMKCPTGFPYASADPWVCLIPGREHWISGNATGGTEGGIKGIKKAAGVTFSADAINPDGYLELGKVLLNTYFLWNTFLDSKTIDEYVLKVARKVNNVCGGFWNIELVDDPLDSSTMRIIDKNFVPDVAAPSLNIYGNTSARSWGMSTDIPQALRHSIMMGTQRKNKKGPKNTDEPQGSYLDYADGVKDRFLGDQELDSDLNPGEGCDSDGGTEKKSGTDRDFKTELEQALLTLSDNRDDESVDEVKGAMKAYWNLTKPPADNGGAVIPIGFDGKFDGIGGIHWGQLFVTKQTSAALGPKVKHKFQVTSVKHSIDQSDWTTSIETALRI
jgi:hypothetical protein